MFQGKGQKGRDPVKGEMRHADHRKRHVSENQIEPKPAVHSVDSGGLSFSRLLKTERPISVLSLSVCLAVQMTNEHRAENSFGHFLLRERDDEIVPVGDDDSHARSIQQPLSNISCATTHPGAPGESGASSSESKGGNDRGKGASKVLPGQPSSEIRSDEMHVGRDGALMFSKVSLQKAKSCFEFLFCCTRAHVLQLTVGRVLTLPSQAVNVRGRVHAEPCPVLTKQIGSDFCVQAPFQREKSFFDAPSEIPVNITKFLNTYVGY
jgi:hypothetical protein